MAALLDGGWRRLDVGRFEWLVAAAAALDVVTTADVLLHDRNEMNLLFSWLATIDVRLAVLAFTALAASAVLLAWLDLGWFSVAVGTAAIVAYGSGSVHNVVLRLTGWGPKLVLPVSLPTQIHVVEPVLGAVLGVALAYYWYGSLPWREVAVYWVWVASNVAVTIAML